MAVSERSGTRAAAHVYPESVDPDAAVGSLPCGAAPLLDGQAQSGRRLRALRFAFWGIGLFLGAFDGCYRQFALCAWGPFDDAVSYLNLAAAYARGNWAHALNAYWSPLYSALLALPLRLLRPGIAAEFSVAHGLNLLIFVAALGSFDFFWRAWLEEHRARAAAARSAGWLSLSEEVLLALGYGLFLWSSIRLIGVQRISPDLLVAALLYLATGLTLRLRRGSGSLTAGLSSPALRTAALLGFVLGLGYLAKAVMLPLAVVYLLVAFLPARRAGRTGIALLAAGLAFLCITVPFIAALSRREGRFTLGDTGRLNYAWYVNGAPRFNWQGQPPGSGRPEHPTRVLYPAPPVYEFASPVGGTYPIWTDPSYWNAGLRPHFNLLQQLGAIRKNLKRYSIRFPWAEQRGLAAGVFLLLTASAWVAKRRWFLLVRWDLLLLAVTPAVLYGLVVVEPRYLGASVVLFWSALLPAVRLPAHRGSKALIAGTEALMLLTLGWGLARGSIRDIRRWNAGDQDWATAMALHTAGVHAGDPVGCLGFSWDIGWAEMAGVKVIAEIPTPNEEAYWTATARVKREVLDAFARTGVRAVVAEELPAGRGEEGWRRLGATRRYVRLLPSPRRDHPSKTPWQPDIPRGAPAGATGREHRRNRISSNRCALPIIPVSALGNHE